MIVLKGPEGIRRVGENVPYRLLPGEYVLGSERDKTEEDLNDALAKESIKLGDFVEKAIKLIPAPLRPVHCTKCEKKRLVLNKVKELGLMETLRRMREIQNEVK